MASLDCLRPHGVMVTFGNASGPVDPFAPAELAKRHSLYVTRPVLFDFIATREDLLGASSELFEVVAAGTVTVNVKSALPAGRCRTVAYRSGKHDARPVQPVLVP